jgi:hypothetical protein
LPDGAVFIMATPRARLGPDGNPLDSGAAEVRGKRAPQDFTFNFWNYVQARK